MLMIAAVLMFFCTHLIELDDDAADDDDGDDEHNQASDTRRVPALQIAISQQCRVNIQLLTLDSFTSYFSFNQSENQ